MSIYHEWWEDYKRAVRRDDNVVLILLLIGLIALVSFFPIFVVAELVKRVSRILIGMDND